jgi:hypothetical protein
MSRLWNICPAARCPGRLLMSSRGIHCYSSPAAYCITPHNLTSPPYFPLSTYILVEQPPSQYAQRLDWVSGHHMTREQHASLSPAPQVTQVVTLVAPVTPEYVPAQHRHASVDRHEAVRVALLHQLPSAATRHAPMLHLSSAPHFAPHTLLGQ